ncbi:hypothetical protein FM036_45685 [Nostoc sp. HG1]|nr:hypothetical protein [Nostoc sp. HG1]
MKLVQCLWIAIATLTLLLGLSQSTFAQQNCDSAYPDVCIPSPPPDLDCTGIEFSNFRVLAPDPHRFDRDQDGIGCEA